MSNFSIFFPPDQKKSLRVGSKSTRFKGELASYLLRFKSKLGSGQGLSLKECECRKDFKMCVCLWLNLREVVLQTNVPNFTIYHEIVTSWIVFNIIFKSSNLPKVWQHVLDECHYWSTPCDHFPQPWLTNFENQEPIKSLIEQRLKRKSKHSLMLTTTTILNNINILLMKILEMFLKLRLKGGHKN